MKPNYAFSIMLAGIVFSVVLAAGPKEEKADAALSVKTDTSEGVQGAKCGDVKITLPDGSVFEGKLYPEKYPASESYPKGTIVPIGVEGYGEKPWIGSDVSDEYGTFGMAVKKACIK